MQLDVLAHGVSFGAVLAIFIQTIIEFR